LTKLAHNTYHNLNQLKIFNQKNAKKICST